MRPKKNLGQNFLIDKNIINKINESFEVNSNDLILEIGPGKGYLTEYLLKKEGFYIGIELDRRMESILSKFINIKTTFIYEDFLKVNLDNILNKYKYDNLHIVGNLPYYITTPIISKILKNNTKFTTMTIMVQKEVGERFLAKPKTKAYGYYTVLLQNHFNITKVTDVSNTSFKPIPQVNSTVLQFTLKDNINYDGNFDKFIKLMFQNKRKTLKNNLKDYDFNKIKDTLLENNLNENVRAEELNIDIIKEIYSIVS